MLQNNSNIKSLIEKLWNNFWSGGISNPLTAIEQITYLIFMKRLDDLAPQLGQRMADPSSGTGGFILGYYQYILSDLVRKTDPSKLIKDEDGFERATMSAILTDKVKQIIRAKHVWF